MRCYARISLLCVLAVPSCFGHGGSRLAADGSAAIGICAAINDANPQGPHRQACEDKRASLHDADVPDDISTANELCSDQENLATPPKDGSRFNPCLRRALPHVKSSSHQDVYDNVLPTDLQFSRDRPGTSVVHPLGEPRHRH